jgi:hypothetical protein
MDKKKGIIVAGLIISGLWLWSRRNTGGISANTLTAEQLAVIMTDTNNKLAAAANLAAKGDYSGAAKTAQDAATVAFNAGNTNAASKAAIQAASYADQSQQITAATAAAQNNTYYPATEATIAAGLSTAFEMANSGMGGNVAVGQTITVTGMDGTKTFINTGNGYAEYTPALATAQITTQSLDTTSLKNAIISSGYATSTQINAMTDAQFEVYAATVIANNPSIATKADASTPTQTNTQQFVGTITVPVNTGTGAPTQTTVAITADQQSSYNSAISSGYSPFQAAIIAGITK